MQASSLPPVMPHPHYYAPPPGAPLLFPCYAAVPVPVCDTTVKLKKATTKVPMLRQLKEPAHDALTNYLVSLLQSRWRGYAMRKKYTDDEPAVEPPAYDGGKVKANQVAPGP